MGYCVICSGNVSCDGTIYEDEVGARLVRS